MRRRAFITGLALAASAPPVLAEPPKRLLATLSAAAENAPPSPGLWAAFWEGMRGLGYSAGDFTVATRSADGHPERLARLAAELVRLGPQIIVCWGSEATQAAKRATSTIPIVMTLSADPVGAGLVASIARPGGNVTGLSLANPELAGKHIELLKTMLPQAKRIAVLTNAHDPTHANRSAEIIRFAGSVGCDAFAVAVTGREQIAAAFDAMAQRNAEALIVLGTPLFLMERADIIALASQRRLPALYDNNAFVPAGGLMSYGADVRALFRRAAYYVDRILKGAKPADLPVEQPTKFALRINLKTAKALGLAVPPSLLARADEVIE